MRICKIDGCENEHRAKGYCKSHYDNWRKYDDPLHIKKQESHGMHRTSEYSSWHHMKKRCYNPNDKYYHRYGGRGITVCDSWRNSFTAFFKDIGLKPFKGAQIDRIDNDKGYYKENCRWVSNAINSRHRSTNKLTMQKAEEIRELYNNGRILQKELACIYGVSIVLINLIIRNEIWNS